MWVAAALAVVTKSFSLAATGTLRSAHHAWPAHPGFTSSFGFADAVCVRVPADVIFIAQSPGWVRTDMGGDKADLSVEQSVVRVLPAADSFLLLPPCCSASLGCSPSRVRAACVLSLHTVHAGFYRAVMLRCLLLTLKFTLCLGCAGPLLVLVRRLACWALWTR